MQTNWLCACRDEKDVRGYRERKNRVKGFEGDTDPKFSIIATGMDPPTKCIAITCSHTYVNTTLKCHVVVRRRVDSRE